MEKWSAVIGGANGVEYIPYASFGLVIGSLFFPLTPIDNKINVVKMKKCRDACSGKQIVQTCMDFMTAPYTVTHCSRYLSKSGL